MIDKNLNIFTLSFNMKDCYTKDIEIVTALSCRCSIKTIPQGTVSNNLGLEYLEDLKALDSN